MFSALIEKLKLRGATDNTEIGNAGDRLKVDASFSGGNGIPSIANDLRYEDMNASTGGVARDTQIGTSYTAIYSTTSSGIFFGFVLTLEDEKKWDLRLTVDGQVVFEINTGDLDSDNIYDFDFSSNNDPFHLGFNLDGKTIRWRGPSGYPIGYTSGVTLEVKHISSLKKFKAGLACLTK